MKSIKSMVQEVQEMYQSSNQEGLTLFRLTKTQLNFSGSKKIRQSADAAIILQDIYQKAGNIGIVESMYALFVNRSNQIIGYAKLSEGGIAGTVLDNTILFKYAVNCLASGIFLAHNHPSGNLNPSEADKKVTRSAVQAGQIMKIPILDHLIMTEGSYFSFADDGLI
jgi:DNA repair protein RadC